VQQRAVMIISNRVHKAGHAASGHMRITVKEHESKAREAAKDWCADTALSAGGEDVLVLCAGERGRSGKARGFGSALRLII
jgi:hypothetical protein